MPLTLDDFKAILSESNFFPISEDLDEIFRELEHHLKKSIKLTEEKSEIVVDHH